MSDKNYMSDLGVTDEEVIAEFGDPGETDIDTHAATVQRGRNAELYMSQGHGEKLANQMAHKEHAITMNRIMRSKKSKSK